MFKGSASGQKARVTMLDLFRGGTATVTGYEEEFALGMWCI